MTPEYKRKFKIDSSETDFQNQLKVSEFVNMFIQVATDHADELKFGFIDLQPAGLSWVLSRFTIAFYQPPKWRDEITVLTWPKGLNRLFYRRDAIAFMPDGSECARITADWLIIDKETRRPKLFDKDNPVLHAECDKHAISEASASLKFCIEATTVKSFVIRYGDIDLNRHLTATRYIDFMFDMYELSFLEANRPKELVVNYIREALFDETVIMKQCIKENIHLFELVEKQSDKVLFRAKLYF